MKKRLRWIVSLALVLLVTGFAVRSFQEPIGAAIVERVAHARVGADSTKGLKDGLHVGLCGTGSPLPNPDRAGPCTFVIAGKRIMVVDAGEGGARNIQLMGIPTGKIDRLFLTHFHSDHIDGMGPLMLLRWTGAAATSPLPVHGPTGVQAVIEGFNAAYARDNSYRTAHHGAAIAPPSGAGSVAVPFEIAAESAVIFEADGLKVTAFKVDHNPVAPAVGYRFDYKGRSVVISGDTAKSTNLEKFSQGADLLLHEALQPKLVAKMTKALDAKKISNTAQITRDIIGYHATPEEATESAQKADVGKLVLTHIVPPLPSRFFNPAFLGDADDRFDGEIVVGEDGMLFSLPAGSKAIEQRELM